MDSSVNGGASVEGAGCGVGAAAAAAACDAVVEEGLWWDARGLKASPSPPEAGPSEAEAAGCRSLEIRIRGEGEECQRRHAERKEKRVSSRGNGGNQRSRNFEDTLDREKRFVHNQPTPPLPKRKRESRQRQEYGGANAERLPRRLLQGRKAKRVPSQSALARDQHTSHHVPPGTDGSPLWRPYSNSP